MYGVYRSCLLVFHLAHAFVEDEASAAVRAELATLKPSALRKQAVALGATDASLDEASDAENYRASLVELVVALKTTKVRQLRMGIFM